MMKRIGYLMLSCCLLCTLFFSGCEQFLNAYKQMTGSSSASSSAVQTEYALMLTKTNYEVIEAESVMLLLTFTANGKDADFSLLTFESDNENVATVDAEGKVTGISVGTAKITATYMDKKVEATVTVTMNPKRVVLSEDFLALLKGTSATVTATAYIETTEDENAELVWTSANPTIATVENGTITAVSGGETTISVAYGTATAVLKVFVAQPLTEDNVNSFDEEYINIYGRSYISNNELNLDHAANAVEIGIIGTSLWVTLNATATSYMQVFTDNDTVGTRIRINSGTKNYTVAQNLTDGYHKIRIVKATEEQNAIWNVVSFTADAFATIPEKSDLKIEFIGDSLTAGYAVLGSAGAAWSVENSDCANTYTYFAAQALNADYSTIAWSGICTKAYHWVGNLNMETLYQRVSNANKNQYAFDFNPDVIVLNLGSNEASYLGYGGAGYEKQFPTDYQNFLTLLRQKNPNAYIICLLGEGTSSVIEQCIATAVNNMNDDKIVYNPFEYIANGAGGAGHPTLEAQKAWGESLAEYIKNLDL